MIAAVTKAFTVKLMAGHEVEVSLDSSGVQRPDPARRQGFAKSFTMKPVKRMKALWIPGLKTYLFFMSFRTHVSRLATRRRRVAKSFTMKPVKRVNTLWVLLA